MPTIPVIRYLAICADDFGLHAGINIAAIQLAAMRRITAVSCLVAATGWRDGCAGLQDLDPRQIDVGLHLDFSEYTIAKNQRRSLPALILAAHAGLLSPVRIRDEINAQLDAFEMAMGRAPSHVDGHRHVHQLPAIRDVLIDVLRHRYPRHLPWVRVALPPATARGNLRPARFKSWLVRQLGSRQFRKIAQTCGQPHSVRLLGVYGFNADTARYQQLLANWLREARIGDVLMCHPSTNCKSLNDPILRARMSEWTALTSPAFTNTLAETGMVLAPMSQILARGQPE